MFFETNRTYDAMVRDDIYPIDMLDIEQLRGSYVLDLAGGSEGAFVADLRERGVNAVNIDLNARMDDVSPHANNVRGDMINLPFQNKTFDYVYRKMD